MSEGCDNEELMKEVKELRNEIHQIKEIINMLLNMIIEGEMEDERELDPTFNPEQDRFNIYN